MLQNWFSTPARGPEDLQGRAATKEQEELKISKAAIDGFIAQMLWPTIRGSAEQSGRHS